MLEPVGWTEERIALMRKLYDEGRSFSAIAKELGGVSRNAVIGKASRLKFPGRPTLQARSAVAKKKPHANKGMPKVNAIVAKAKVRRQTPQIEPEPVVVEVDDGVDVTHLLGIMELRPDSCRWVHGDPLGEHGYCGQKTQSGSSWCPEHHGRVYGGGRA